MAQRQLVIEPVRRVQGTLDVPGDKSIAHRYAMLAAISAGTSEIAHLAPGADVATTLACMQALGASIQPRGPLAVRITGCGARGLSAPAAPLDAGNSGTTMRLLAGIVASYPFRTVMTGDESLSRRPMTRVIEPLTAMGATIQSTNGRAPLDIHGARLRGITWHPPVASAQIKSAVLLAGLRAQGTTAVEEDLPTRDHTERALPAFGIDISVSGRRASLAGGQVPTAPAGVLTVPGDPSSAAVWAAAAAALPGSSVRLEGVGLNPLRLGFLRALEHLGARVTIEQTGEMAGEPIGAIEVAHGDRGAAVIAAPDVPSLIDELPVLAACAALGGRLDVSGAAELRVKESDRITALVSGLRALGVEADERPDGFVVAGTRRPRGGTVDAVGDHRLVMAFALVGLGASAPTVVRGAEAVAVSYPGFEADLAGLVA
ncbi:MAG TPA: 3-phosphoshikimate 1-carboxyvinyltransferase [Vicinamibacterales bacterium]|nr:3-phosphoshikimate 1-carboxyvinyltransferase [Vicinamibacterales bacterium]